MLGRKKITIRRNGHRMPDPHGQFPPRLKINRNRFPARLRRDHFASPNQHRRPPPQVKAQLLPPNLRGTVSLKRLRPLQISGRNITLAPRQQTKKPRHQPIGPRAISCSNPLPPSVDGREFSTSSKRSAAPKQPTKRRNSIPLHQSPREKVGRKPIYNVAPKMCQMDYRKGSVQARQKHPHPPAAEGSLKWIRPANGLPRGRTAPIRAGYCRRHESRNRKSSSSFPSAHARAVHPPAHHSHYTPIPPSRSTVIHKRFSPTPPEPHHPSQRHKK